MTKWNPEDTPSFSRSEMACKCPCGRSDMDADFMAGLQSVRDAVGALSVSSGFRCESYNTTLKGGPAHPLGKAADVLVSGRQAYDVVSLARDYGMTGIGVSQRGPHPRRFIHIDSMTADEGPRPMIWSY